MHQTARHLDQRTLGPQHAPTLPAASRPESSAPRPRRGLGIRTKFLLIFVTLGLVVLAVAAWFAYLFSYQAIREERLSRFRVVRDLLTQEVNTYFQRIRLDVASRAELTARAAVTELAASRRTLLSELKEAGVNVDEAMLRDVVAANRAYYEATLLKGLKTAYVGAKQQPEFSPERWMPSPADPVACLLQYVYLVKNPGSLGAKRENWGTEFIAENTDLDAKFRRAFANTSHAKALAKYQVAYQHAPANVGADDVYLADADGTVLFSVNSGFDFGSNLRSGPNRNNGLAKNFLSAWESSPPASAADQAAKVTLTDFTVYDPAFGATSAFASAPVTNAADGRKTGVIIYRVGTSALNKLLSFNGQWQELGLGKAGILQMFGTDYTLRSEYRLRDELPAERKRPKLDLEGKKIDDTAELKMVIKTSATQALFDSTAPTYASGGKAEVEYVNSRGVTSLGVVSRLNIPGIESGMIIGMPTDEAFAAVHALQRNLLKVAGLLLLGLMLVSMWLARSFARPINGLANAAAAIAGGDNTVRAPVESRDEIGQAATQFNAMVEARLAAQTKAEEENKFLQNDIRELLTVVSDAADGDMTVRAKVTEGALGNVADAFNLMAENIGDLLQQVQAAAARVDHAAGGMKGSAETLAAGAAEQAGHIGNTTEALHQMSANLQVVSLNAEAANGAANEAARAADTGNAAVAEVMEGMERIRRSVQSSAKKIKRLGERSMEISTILGTIQAISAQTDMLALNASIEAARAGEEGRGFTIVAEEVRKLSERTAQATKEIERLVAAIQTDTGEAVTGMEGQIAEVERESTAVSGAGTELERIRHTITESALLIGAIHEASKEQAQGAVQIVDFMSEVRTIAQQAQTGSEQTKNASAEMSGLAGQLTSAVGKFKVAAPDAPASDAPAPPAEVPVNGLSELPAVERNGQHVHA